MGHIFTNGIFHKFVKALFVVMFEGYRNCFSYIFSTVLAFVQIIVYEIVLTTNDFNGIENVTNDFL